MIFLIEYNKPAGRIVTLKRFDDSDLSEAENSRLEIELRLKRQGRDNEVILLQATNEEALRRTHRRYFETARSIAASTGEDAN